MEHLCDHVLQKQEEGIRNVFIGCTVACGKEVAKSLLDLAP